MRRRVRRDLYLFMFFTWTKKKGFGVFSTFTYEYTGCRTLKNNQKRGKLPVRTSKSWQSVLLFVTPLHPLSAELYCSCPITSWQTDITIWPFCFPFFVFLAKEVSAFRNDDIDRKKDWRILRSMADFLDRCPRKLCRSLPQCGAFVPLASAPYLVETSREVTTWSSYSAFCLCYGFPFPHSRHRD